MIDFFKKLFSSSDNLPTKQSLPEDTLAQKLIEAYGGESNILSVNACITRLRIEVETLEKVDQAAIKSLGAKGVIVVGNNAQSVFGADSDKLKDEIGTILGKKKVEGWIEEFGGIENIRSISVCALTRIRIETKKPVAVKEERLKTSGVQAVVQIDETLYHLLIGLDAPLYIDILDHLV